MEWINEKDKLPEQVSAEESQKVLVYITDINGNSSIDIMKYNHLQGFWNTKTGTCKVKYWQHLPKAPNKDLLSLHGFVASF